MTVILYQFLIE